MHVLTLFVEGIATPFSLHYRGAEEAGVAYKRVSGVTGEGIYEVVDDFGQRVSVGGYAIKGVVLLDLAQGLEAHLLMMEAQAKAQRKAPGSAIMMSGRIGQ